MKALLLWLQLIWGRFSRRWRLVIVEGDSLPDQLPDRTIVLAREDGDDWCAGMKCPCGCGHRIELLLLPEAKPRWNLRVGSSGRPSLTPSVWLKEGCRSHFWVRDGRIFWCK